MKKILSCIVVATVMLLSLCACSEEGNETSIDEDDDTVISNIAVSIYDEDDVLQKTINYATDNNVSLYVGTVYIFKIYLSPAHGAIVFTDNAIQFSFDSNYISMEDCDSENEVNNTFYFTGLQAAESTLLTISMSAADAPKDIIITLAE